MSLVGCHLLLVEDDERVVPMTKYRSRNPRPQAASSGRGDVHDVGLVTTWETEGHGLVERRVCGMLRAEKVAHQ